ncbi:GNAT family N-acetyltransferase [Membranihabitans marinus]
MTADDVAAGQRLVFQAGWNQRGSDWVRMMDMDPNTCFVVEINHKVVATIVATVFQSVAWISMVLVDKDSRGQGIGKLMFQYVLDQLNLIGVSTIRLDATGMGIALYQKFGFVEEYRLVRYRRQMSIGEHAVASPSSLTELTALNIPAIMTLDRIATDTDRQSLIRQWIEDSSVQVFGNYADKVGNPIKLNGFVLARPGNSAWQLGPCIALDNVHALDLLNKVLATLSEEALILDLPASNQQAVQWALAHGFEEERQFARMFLGRKIREDMSLIYASSGPEKG